MTDQVSSVEARLQSRLRVSQWQRDALAVVLLAGLAAAGSWLGSGMAVAADAFPGREGASFNDVWFDADSHDALVRLTLQGEPISAERHPFEGLLMRAPLRVFMRIAPGVEAVSLLRATLAMMAALWAALLFACFRVAGCLLSDAVLFAALAIVSAASMFWFVVPDYFVASAVSALPAMLVAARAGRTQVCEWASAAAAFLSLSVSVTNAMFGVAATVVAHRVPRALQVLANALCLAAVLWLAQRVIYPRVDSPLEDQSHWQYFLLPDSHTPAGPVAAFFFHSMVMPQVDVATMRTVSLAHGEGEIGETMLTVQASLPGSGGALGVIAVIAWLGILIAGAVTLWRSGGMRPLRTYLVLVTAGQLVLHLLFGAETFLYAPHFLPPLLMIGAAGTLGRLRPVVRGLAAVLLVCVTINNVSQLMRSFSLVPPIVAARYGQEPR